MSKNIRLSANAKINLSLDVISKQEKKHELDMTILPIKLSNKIRVKKSSLDKDIVYLDGVVSENTNIEKLLKLARTLKALPFFIVKVKSKIPSCAGLGSSSADAACMLRFLEKNYGVEVDKLFMDIKAIGNDILPMYYNKNLRVFGEDEKIEFLELNKKYNNIYVLCNDIKFSTRNIFKEYDKKPIITQYTKNFIKNNSLIGNALTNTAMEYSKDFKQDYEWCKKNFKEFIMTGSGSAIIVLDKITHKKLKITKKRFKRVIKTHLYV